MSTDNKDAVRVAFELAAPNHKINIERTSQKAQALGIDGYKYEYARQMFIFFSDAYQAGRAGYAAQAERIKQLEHEIWCAGVNADGAQEKSGERIATLEAALQHESASALAHERRHQELLHEKMQSADLQAAIMALTCELPAGYDDSRERLIYLQSHNTAVARAAALVASARPSAAQAAERAATAAPSGSIGELPPLSHALRNTYSSLTERSHEKLVKEYGQACIAADRASRTPPAGVDAAAVAQQKKDTDQAREFLVGWMRANFPTDRTFTRYINDKLAGDFAWQLATALAATPVPAPQAGPSIPPHLREFVEAIAHRFDAIDRETDDEFCKGCSGLAVWDEDTRQSYTHHRPDCIVLRAEDLLAATPSPQGAETPKEGAKL